MSILIHIDSKGKHTYTNLTPGLPFDSFCNQRFHKWIDSKDNKPCKTCEHCGLFKNVEVLPNNEFNVYLFKLGWLK